MPEYAQVAQDHLNIIWVWTNGSTDDGVHFAPINDNGSGAGS